MTGGEIALMLTAIGGIVTGVIGAVVAALTVKSAARKDEVESLRTIIETLQDENNRLRIAIEKMEKEVEEREARIKELETEVQSLRSHIAALEVTRQRRK